MLAEQQASVYNMGAISEETAETLKNKADVEAALTAVEALSPEALTDFMTAFNAKYGCQCAAPNPVMD